MALANHVGLRERVLDEHMYRLPPEAGYQVTFRLQLFTAAGLRPVAVATQMPLAGEGTSLTNAAETCAAVVWQQHFPDDQEPPIWIAHMIMEGRRDLQAVTFAVDRAAGTLHDPGWRSVSSADVDALVGQPVDLERGSGFVAPEPELEPESVYVAMPVVLLPRPRPFRKAGCMATGVPWWRRLGRQLFPRRGGRRCWRYHGGDWHVVSRVAVRLAEQARAAGVSFEDTTWFVLGHPDAESLGTWEREALYSLLTDTTRPYAPWPFRRGTTTASTARRRSSMLACAGPLWSAPSAPPNDVPPASGRPILPKGSPGAGSTSWPVRGGARHASAAIRKLRPASWAARRPTSTDLRCVAIVRVRRPDRSVGATSDKECTRGRPRPPSAPRVAPTCWTRRRGYPRVNPSGCRAKPPTHGDTIKRPCCQRHERERARRPYRGGLHTLSGRIASE